MFLFILMLEIKKIPLKGYFFSTSSRLNNA